MRDLPCRIQRRIRLAVQTKATARQWMDCALLLAGFMLVAIPFGMATGLLVYSPTADSFGSLLIVAVVAFVAPSLIEELMFRAVPVPHASERSPLWRKALLTVVATTAFTAWHPLCGWLFVPAARQLFYNAAFLVLCAGFGLTSAAAYLRTGSLWPSVAMHWSVVFGWKLWFGGWIMAFGPKG